MHMNFACTECGKCCHFPDGHRLIIAPAEWQDYVDRFPLYLGLEVWRADVLAKSLQEGPNSLPKKEAWDHVQATGELFKQPFANGQTLYLLLRPQVFALPGPDGNCQALVGNKCSIYADRPLVCRSYPAVTNQPLHDLASTSLEKARMDIANDGYECDVSTSAPLFLTDGAPLPPAIARDIDTYWRGLREFGKKLLWSPLLQEFRDQIPIEMPKNVSRMWPIDLLPIIELSPPVAGRTTEDIVGRQMQLLEKVMSYPKTNAATQMAGHIYGIYLKRGFRQPSLL